MFLASQIESSLHQVLQKIAIHFSPYPMAIGKSPCSPLRKSNTCRGSCALHLAHDAPPISMVALVPSRTQLS